MIDFAIALMALIFVNVLVSLRGFTNYSFMVQYQFRVKPIRWGHDYKRLVTAGFLHQDWSHLIFNMIALYAFGEFLELSQGSLFLLLIYFSGLIGGNLLSLYVHRNHPDYAAIGASGAVCAIIFSCIAFDPSTGIGMVLLPLHIPGWLFGMLYLAWTIFGIKTQQDNIAHEGHLGGALSGLLVTVIVSPVVIAEHPIAITLLAIPAIGFIFYIILRPHSMLFGGSQWKKSGTDTLDNKYNAAKRQKQQELDLLLDKINRKGMGGLTAREKQRLKELSS